MTMSPGGPPRCPRPPCPFSRIFDPVSTPEGTVMMTFFLLRFSPAPPHAGHRTLGTPPLPRHIGHGRFTANPPWPNEIVPRPPHRSEEHTSELQSQSNLVCRLLLEQKSSI